MVIYFWRQAKELFKADGSYDKYFGSTWTSRTARNWTNYISDVEKLIREEQCPEVLASLEILKKKRISCESCFEQDEAGREHVSTCEPTLQR